MPERLQRPGPAATPADHMRFVRDWSLVLAAGCLLLAAPDLMAGGRDGTLLAVCAGLCVLSAIWIAGVIRLVDRRAGTGGAAHAIRNRESAQPAGEWLVTVAIFPVSATVALVEGTTGDLSGLLALSGFMLAAVRLAMHRYQPDSLAMTDADAVRLTRLVKLTTLVAIGGCVTVIIIAIGGGETWAPVWPGLTLGVVCGGASLAQLARATGRHRAGGPAGG